jgi:hypothetical protein
VRGLLELFMKKRVTSFVLPAFEQWKKEYNFEAPASLHEEMILSLVEEGKGTICFPYFFLEFSLSLFSFCV